MFILEVAFVETRVLLKDRPFLMHNKRKTKVYIQLQYTLFILEATFAETRILCQWSLCLNYTRIKNKCCTEPLPYHDVRPFNAIIKYPRLYNDNIFLSYAQSFVKSRYIYTIIYIKRLIYFLYLVAEGLSYSLCHFHFKLK